MGFSAGTPFLATNFMEKPLVVETRPVPGTREHTVWIVRGVQSFRLDYRASKKECDWYARMLRIALRIKERKRNDGKSNIGATGISQESTGGD